VEIPCLNYGDIYLYFHESNSSFFRTSLQLAEVEREGGISPHISPMTGRSSVN